MSATTFWIGEPRSVWLLGSLLILGCLTPFILKTHEQTHPFFVDWLWPKFWICTAPVWLLTLQYIIGLTQDPSATITLGESSFHTIEPFNIWRPTSFASHENWLTLFGFSATYLMASALFIIPKSRSFFERLFSWLCAAAVLVCVFGYIQKGLGLEKALFTNGTGTSAFFAFFPYDGHWAAFATLWCCACIAMALLSNRYLNSEYFIHSTGPWYLTGGALLGASGFLVEALIPSAILLLTFSAMLLLVAVDFLANSKDPHRNSIALTSGLVASLMFAGGIFRIFQDGAFTEESAALRSAALDMFRGNPIFGWGIDSYERLLPFYSHDSLLGVRNERASSDLLQFMAEFGLFGLLVVIGFLLAYLVRYAIGPHNIKLTNHLLIGCGAIGIMALVDTPFMSPAVFYSFLVTFFGALRWADLSRNKVDEVDAPRPQLVTSENLRRVPFFNKQYEDKTK